MQLAKRGLQVTGSDVSEAAINRARKVYVHNNKDKEICFIVDNILNSKIKDKSFDYVFDRGCFHILPIQKRLKCFSVKEPRQEGPYKFSEDEIKQLFGNDFVIISVKDTVYQGRLDPLPRALFVAMNKRRLAILLSSHS
jgi:hypothetical protein